MFIRGAKHCRPEVTGIATCFENANTLISSSRDKTVMVWELTPNDSEPGYARKCLTGHNQAVQDVVTSSDGQFAMALLYSYFSMLIIVMHAYSCFLLL